MTHRQPLIWAALSILIKIFNALPHKRACALGRRFGLLVRFFSGKRARAAEGRCADILGISREDARAVVKGTYSHFGAAAAEFARLPAMAPKIDNIIRIHGEENLKNAYDRGKGVIVTTAHIGNWEYAAVWIAHRGYRINALGADQRDDRITQLINDTRMSGGVNALGKSSDLKKMISALKNGEIIAMPIDQDAKRAGVVSPFLGRPASTPVGIAKLAGKFDCAVVPMFCIRKDGGETFDLYALPAMTGRNGARYGENIQESIDDCNDIFSEWIRKYPDQWLWIYPRWESVERGLFK